MSQFNRTLFIYLSVLLITSCSSQPSYLERSDHPINAPVLHKPFEAYVKETRQQILKVLVAKQSPPLYQGDYSHEDAADMRAPFQIPEVESNRCMDIDKGGNKGFLLVHGLTDSPYLMKGLADSVRNRYPCSLIRAIVLPGHSTVPGDSLGMTHEEWLKATAYGVRSFDKVNGIESLFVMSFSTGAPLLIRHIAESESENSKIKGAVFISAAIKAKTKWASLSPFLQYFWTWGDKNNEQDAARYESFSLHAGAEFYKLTKVLDDKKYKFKLPLFVAISADDTTVSAEDALYYFCNAQTKFKKLLWYENADSKPKYSDFAEDVSTCDNYVVKRNAIDVRNKPENYKNFSHISLSMPVNDTHYGANGNYKQCKYYFDFDNPQKSEFTNCVTTDRYITGEGTQDLKALAEKENIPWHRGTYNADYAYMEQQILEFVESIP